MQFRYLGNQPLDVDVIHQANQQVTRLTIPVSTQPITTNDSALFGTIFAPNFAHAELFEKIEDDEPKPAKETVDSDHAEKESDDEDDTSSASKRKGKK